MHSITVNRLFIDVVGQVTDALKRERFDVLTEIDVQETLQTKLGIKGRPYRVIIACIRPLARRAPEGGPEIESLLPCNVIVREEDDRCISIDFMDSHATLSLLNRPDLHTLASEVHTRCARVRASLAALH